MQVIRKRGFYIYQKQGSYEVARIDTCQDVIRPYINNHGTQESEVSLPNFSLVYLIDCYSSETVVLLNYERAKLLRTSIDYVKDGLSIWVFMVEG